MSLKYDQFLSQEELERFSRFFDEPPKHSSVAFDDNDLDPDSEAARWAMIASELSVAEKRRNQRKADAAERNYAKRFQEMNKLGLRS